MTKPFVRLQPWRRSLLASAWIPVVATSVAPLDFDPSRFLAIEVAEAGSCCFRAGTRIRMADGSERPIQALAAGGSIGCGG